MLQFPIGSIIDYSKFLRIPFEFSSFPSIATISHVDIIKIAQKVMSIILNRKKMRITNEIGFLLITFIFPFSKIYIEQNFYFA